MADLTKLVFDAITTANVPTRAFATVRLTKLAVETRTVADVVSNKRLLLMRRANRAEASSVTEAVTVTRSLRTSTGVNLSPGFLTRNGSFLDTTASWTICLWARPHTSTPTAGNFRQYYNIGLSSGSYIYLGSNFASNDLILEVSDGTNYFDSTAASTPLGQWLTIAATYSATTHLLTLYANNAVVGTLTHDLSSFPAIDPSERIGAWGDHETAQIRFWQAALTPAEIAAESEAHPAVRSANLLADTPLSSPTDLGDISGHGRDWTASGSLNTVSGPPVPRTSLVARVSDAVTARELRPAEPPGPIRQVALPAGYQLPKPFTPVPPYTDWYGNQLTYGGPWPSGTFTCCFWAQNLAIYHLKGVYTAYPNPIGEIQLIGNQFGGIGSIGFEVNQGTPNYYDNVYLEIPIDTAYGWHHLAILRDGPDTLLSVDNRPWASVTTPGAAGIPWGSEWFEAKQYVSPQNTPPVIPRAAYYRMWDAALGLNELRREARSRQAVRTANLWRDVPLEESPVDISGAGRHWVAGPGGLVVPSYGDGPLPWVAEPVLVREALSPTAQSPDTRQAADLLSATDGLYVRGQRDLPVAKLVSVSELAAVAIARPVATTNRQKRWYAQNKSGAGFNPSGLRGSWTAFRDGESLSFYRLASPDQLVTDPFGISATVGNRTIAGTASTTVCCVVHVTDPLPAQMISGVFNLCYYVYDQKGPTVGVTGLTPRRFKVYVYVTVGTTNTVRGVLLDYTAPASTANHWPGSGVWWQFEAAATLTPVTLQAGDRVVVELGFASDAAWTASGGGIIVYFSGNGCENDPTPNAPYDRVSPDVQWTPGISTIFSNTWVEFTPGILVTPLGVRVYDYIAAQETVTRVIPGYQPQLAKALSEIRAVRERVTTQMGVGIQRWYPSGLLLAQYVPPTFKGTWTETQTRAVGGALTPSPVLQLSPGKPPAWDDPAVATPGYGGDERTDLPSSSENSAVEVDYVLARWVTPWLAAQTLQGTLQMGLQCRQGNGFTSPHTHLHVWVTQGDSDSVRGTLISDFTEAAGNAWPTSFTAGKNLTSPQPFGPLAIQQGDRIVIEFGFRARNVSTTESAATARVGTSEYTQVNLPAYTTFAYISLPDLVVPAAVNQSSWFDFLGSQVRLSPVQGMSGGQTITVTENTTRKLLNTTHNQSPDLVTVIEAVTPLLRTNAVLRPAVFDAITVTTSAGLDEPIIFPPYIPTVGPGIGVFDAIRVREERLRQVASSKLTVSAYEYVRAIDPILPVLYGTFWPGTGTPPAPTPGVFDDYWLVGV